MSREVVFTLPEFLIGEILQDFNGENIQTCTQ